MSFAVTIQIDPEMMKAFNKMTVVFSPHKVSAENTETEITADYTPHVDAPAHVLSEELPTEPDEATGNIAGASEETPDTEPEEKPQVKPETKPGKVVTPEEIRAVAVTKDRQKIKSLLDKYSFKSISSVPEDKRSDFLDELKGC